MKNLRKPLILIMLITIIIGSESCHDMKKKADLIIYNAKIYAPDTLGSNVNCIAVKNGKIIGVGTDAEIRSRYWAKDNINATGSFVYPGFIDAHSHFTGFALGLRFADLSQTHSFEEILEILQSYRKLHPEGWIVGFGWDQNNWPEKVFPDNKLLNKLFPGVPIVLTRIDGHAVLASEEAINAAGVTLPGKSGESVIIKGEFSGIFLEGMADKIKNAIPPPSESEKVDYITVATKLCHEAGLTGVTDAGLNKSEILLLDSLQKSGLLTLRIDAWLTPGEENFEYFMSDIPFVTPFLRVGAVKMYADGALGSRGACLLTPYSDNSPNRGLLVSTPEELYAICKRAYDHGFQMNTHAIGDSAVRMVLKVYTKFLKPDNDRRWRIEHAQVVNESDFALFAAFNIIPSIQSTHATSDMGWAGQRLGKERIKNAYAYKRLLAQNGWLPNGTDFPIEGIEPLKTFYASVARKNTQGLPENGFMPENSLSRMETLKSITIWAAKASFSENVRGSIAVGYDADFTILNTDLIEAPESNILNAKVLYTIVDGKIVFESK